MYDFHRRIAVVHRKYLTVMSGGKNTLTDLDRISANTVLTLPGEKQRQHAANHARAGLREALSTIIAGRGLTTTWGEKTATKRLADTAGQNTGDDALWTGIGLEDYEDLYVPANMTLEQYTLLAIQDIHSLLKTATHRRRELMRTLKEQNPAAAERK